MYEQFIIPKSYMYRGCSQNESHDSIWFNVQICGATLAYYRVSCIIFSFSGILYWIPNGIVQWLKFFLHFKLIIMPNNEYLMMVIYIDKHLIIINNSPICPYLALLVPDRELEIFYLNFNSLLQVLIFISLPVSIPSVDLHGMYIPDRLFLQTIVNDFYRIFF